MLTYGIHLPSAVIEQQTLFRLDGQKFADEYHVFGFAWTEKKLSWYLDGHLIREGVNSSWHLPLNISIGCWDTNRNDLLDPL
jgi:beta-glucanase (GH16 family)